MTVKENPKEVSSFIKNYGMLTFMFVCSLGSLWGMVGLIEYQVKELFSITADHSAALEAQKSTLFDQSSQLDVLNTKFDIMSSNIVDIKKYLRVPA